MEDSEVVAKQLIPTQMIVCASPLYAKNTVFRVKSKSSLSIGASTFAVRRDV